MILAQGYDGGGVKAIGSEPLGAVATSTGLRKRTPNSIPETNCKYSLL